MTLATHVFRRGSSYYHRIRIPCSLRMVFGRQELVRSLKTSDPNLARLIGAKLSAALLKMFETVRQRMGDFSKAEIEDLAKGLYARLLGSDSEARYSTQKNLDWSKDEGVLWRLKQLTSAGQLPEELERQNNLSLAELLKDDEDLLDLEYWEATVKNRDYEETDLLVSLLLDGTSIKVEQESEDYRQLGINAARALIAAKRVAVARADGDLGAHSNDPMFKEVTESYEIAFEPKRRATVRQVTAKFFEERHTNHPAFSRDYGGTLSLFEACFGNERAISSFTRDDIVELKDTLRITPANYKKKYPNISITEAIEKNARDKNPVISVTTINEGHLARLNAVFKWAENNNYVAKNVVQGVRVDGKKTKNKTDARHPFSRGQLSTLFTGPLFTGCDSKRRSHLPGKYKIKDHRYWLPLLGLFTGGRLSELAQLEVMDIRNDGDISFIRIEEGLDEQGNQVKRLKTEDSRRSVPLHSELLKLGFLNYVSEQEKRGERRLFPSCERDKSGSFSAFTKWFGRHLTKTGVKTDKTSFHSFRHNFEDAMRQSIGDEELRRVLAGRAYDTSATIYGDGFSIERLNEEILKISYPELDLSNLYHLK